MATISSCGGEDGVGLAHGTTCLRCSGSGGEGCDDRLENTPKFVEVDEGKEEEEEFAKAMPHQLLIHEIKRNLPEGAGVCVRRADAEHTLDKGRVASGA